MYLKKNIDYFTLWPPKIKKKSTENGKFQFTKTQKQE